jgi:hypothetical protein
MGRCSARSICESRDTRSVLDTGNEDEDWDCIVWPAIPCRFFHGDTSSICSSPFVLPGPPLVSR